MAEESSKQQKKYDTQPNFAWPPARYYMLSAYFLFYNAIANDPKKYGLENSNGNQVINAYIRKFWDQPNRELGLPSLDEEYHTHLTEVQEINNKPPLKCVSFGEDLPHLIAEANRLSMPLHNDGKGNLTGLLSNQEVKELLEQKRVDVRGYHENVRKNAKGKFGDWEGEKSKNGSDYEKYNQALAEYKNKKAILRRSRFRLALKALGALAFAGVTVFSIGALLSVGGMAISSVFGTMYSASSIGTAGLGLIGTVAGGTLTKHLFGKFLEEHAELKRLKQDMREFKKGFGKYADKDGKHFGMKQLRDQFYADRAMKEYLEKGEVKGRRNKKYIKMIKKGKFGIPMEPSDFIKEPAYYKFVTDVYNEGKQNYGFRYMENLLGEAKSFNSSDTQSVQSHVIEAQNAIANPNLGLTDVVKLVRDLKTSEGKFQGDDKFTYDKIMTEYSDKIVDAIREEAFENAYTAASYGDLENAFKDPIVKERLEHTAVGDKVDDVENIVKFVKTSRRYLKPDIGVSIMDQVHLDQSHMEHGAMSLGLDGADPEFANVQTVIGDINSLATRSASPAIETRIASLAVNSSVKKYLETMLQKKTKQTKLGVTDLASISDSAIRSAIASMTRSEEADGIRSRIMVSALSDDEKTEAIKALNKQVESIETKKKDDIYAAVVDPIKNNVSPVFGDYLSKISDIKSFEIDQSRELLNDIKKKTGNTAVANFLVMEFQGRIEELLKNEINTDKYNGGKPEDFGNIPAILIKINDLERNGFISSKQKMDLIKELQPKIKRALDVMLMNAKKDFLKNYDSSKFNTLLEMTYSAGGLKEYFELNTPEINKLKDSVEYMTQLSSLSKLVKETINIDGRVLEETENEAKAFSIIYLLNKEKRDSSDPLYSSIKRMSQISDNLNKSQFGIDVAFDLDGLDFIKHMRGEIANISGISDRNERYAALLILKKRCLGAFKMHASKYFSEVYPSGSIENYMNTPANRTAFEKAVFNKWVHNGVDDKDKGILTLIDSKLKDLEDLEIVKKYAYNKATDSAKKACSESESGAYIRGKEA